MGANATKGNAKAHEKIEMEPAPSDKEISRDHAPASSYAKKVTQRPKLLPEVEDTLIKKFTKKSGGSYPTYELKDRPGMFYHGGWKNGRPDDDGCVYGSNGTYMQGDFKDGKANGKGLHIYPDGSYYDGEFVNNKFEGKGIFFYKLNGMTYNGQWKDNKPNGKGKEDFPNIGQYEGEFLNGLKHGKGQMKWKDGRRYEGDFREGYMDGQGVLKKNNGQYRGQFSRNDKVSGQMKTEYGVYNGPFVNGEMSGNGTFKWYDGKEYTGDFKYNKMHGNGQMKLKDGRIFKGEWENGENVRID